MRRALLLLPVLLLAACGATPSPSSPAAPAPASASASKAAHNPLSDKGWTVVSYELKDDGTGSLGGSARITNTASTSRTVVGKLVVFKAGTQVGNLDLSAQDVAAGQTVTVDLVGTDKYVVGPYTVQFQADMTY